MFEGTTRADFIYRVMKIRQRDIDPEAAKLIEDLFEAFERGFVFACELRKYKMFNSVGELLRLELVNDREGLIELNKEIENRIKKSTG